MEYVLRQNNTARKGWGVLPLVSRIDLVSGIDPANLLEIALKSFCKYLWLNEISASHNTSRTKSGSVPDITPRKTHIAPEKCWLEDDSPILKWSPFLVAFVHFRGGGGVSCCCLLSFTIFYQGIKACAQTVMNSSPTIHAYQPYQSIAEIVSTHGTKYPFTARNDPKEASFLAVVMTLPAHECKTCIGFIPHMDRDPAIIYANRKRC